MTEPLCIDPVVGKELQTSYNEMKKKANIELILGTVLLAGGFLFAPLLLASLPENWSKRVMQIAMFLAIKENNNDNNNNDNNNNKQRKIIKTRKEGNQMISFIRMLALLMAGVTFINGGIISGKTADENYESKDRNSQANIAGEQIQQKQRYYKIISLESQ